MGRRQIPTAVAPESAFSQRDNCFAVVSRKTTNANKGNPRTKPLPFQIATTTADMWHNNKPYCSFCFFGDRLILWIPNLTNYSCSF